MHVFKRALLLLLVISMLLSGCAFGSKAEETAAPTETPTEAPTEVPTEAPTEPPKPEKFRLMQTVFPEKDAATGTLKFYFNGKEVYAGGPVSLLLDIGVTAIDDLNQTVNPWHMTGVIHVRVKQEDGSNPHLFFVAMNASSQPQKITDCMIYSITINTEKGIRFGSGKEKTPFVTGETTLEEITSAYGEPTYNESNHDDYREIAYYTPFSCAYFSFHKDVLRQVTTYYSANVLLDRAENFTYDLGARYFGNDAYILMNQYLDVKPYLPGAEEEVTDGTVEALTEKITMGGQEVVLGVRVDEMPSPFSDQFVNQLMYVNKKYYVRAGRNLGEEFYFINLNGQTNNKKKEPIANALIVKGVLTENKNYANWGKNNGKFFEFQYENLTQDSTIEDVLEQYGKPYAIHCTSYARYCYVWMYYKDQAGNTLEICVDPMLDQLIELRIVKYYEGEIYYE